MASDEHHSTVVPSVAASVTGPSAIQRNSIDEKRDLKNGSPVPTDSKDTATLDTVDDESRLLTGRKLLAVFTGMLLSCVLFPWGSFVQQS